MGHWWFALATIFWLCVVQAIAGPLAAFLSGVSAVMVALVALWEAGKNAEGKADGGAGE